ncbi:Glutamyl-tRNA reductase [hydrothermal vent metagenome]|uniref:glutamyl-tRNA reductase n=1 Tax=hydrothermal vent metagenome TaxID=652676 RepID=A0A1W1EKW3_9ZZZZ
MYYQVISFNHKRCNLEQREKLSFKDNQIKRSILDRLVNFDFIEEAFLVATCNRIEVIIATRDNFASYHAIIGILSQTSKIEFKELVSMAQRFDDEEAIKHIFAVVSSLDSLVVGESQITGQVKEGFKFSYDNGTAGKKLNRILSYAVKCAAEVRNRTTISTNPISIASVAVAQASVSLGDNLAGMTGVVVGAGEMGKLAAKHLLRAGCDVVLLGRDLNKVQDLANELGENVKVDKFEKLDKYINRYRLVFCATSAPTAVITKDMIENSNLKKLWFDMAIPRDIEDMSLENLQIYRIDDLREISDTNHALREEQAIKATEIVEDYKNKFYKWLRALSIEPVIKGIRLDVNDSIEKELKRAISKGFVPKEYEENMRKMAQQMFNHFLHLPTQNLRVQSKEKDSVCSIDAIANIFNISRDEANSQQYKSDHHKKGYQE